MIPLFKPYMPELPEVESILHSGSLAYGNYTKAFEDKLRQYFKTEYLLATNSFNSAITLAVNCLGLNNSDEVILSPLACLASTQAYLTSGLKLRWADIDPYRGTLDPDSVKKNINKRTKCIIHYHFCGYPGYINEINTIGKEYGIPVIDDGLECFGSEYQNKKIGNCDSDVTIFSLSSVRLVNTIDGGCIIFSNKHQYEKAVLARDCGIRRSMFRKANGEIDINCDINSTGLSATMSNFNGYIGLCQMDKITCLIEKQRKQALKWKQEIGKCGKCIPIQSVDMNPNYWVFGILVDDKEKAFAHFNEKGYVVSSVHVDNSKYSIFKNYCSLPGVQTFSSRFLALPCGWWMDKD